MAESKRGHTWESFSGYKGLLGDGHAPDPLILLLIRNKAPKGLLEQVSFICWTTVRDYPLGVRYCARLVYAVVSKRDTVPALSELTFYFAWHTKDRM